MRGAELPGRYFLPEGSPAGGGWLDVAVKQDPVCTLAWRLDSEKRVRALGLSDSGRLLAASFNTGGAAHGLVVFRRTAAGWGGRWITSIDGASTLGEMTIDGDALSGRHRFSGRGRAGRFEGSVNISTRGAAYSMNFYGASGVPLYRGIGVVNEGRLLVAWSFGSSPSLAVYAVDDKGLAGSRFSFGRGQGDAVTAPERLTRDGAGDTIFPPLLPGPAGQAP